MAKSKENVVKDTIKESTPPMGSIAEIAFGGNQHDENLDFVAFRQYPTSEREIETYAHELLTYAKDPNTFKLYKFFRDRGIDRDTVAKWRKRSKIFDKAILFAMEEIGDRREVLALNKKVSESITMFTMPMYDPDWKEETERRSQLNKQEPNQQGGVQVVYLPQAPVTGRVPERGKSEEKDRE